MRPTFSPNRSQSRMSGHVPATVVGMDSKVVDENIQQSIVVRNNRYYIEERPAEKPVERANSRMARERSRSKDSRKREPTPTKEYKMTKMSAGSYVAQAKKKGESPFKAKQNTRNFETSMSKSSYSEAMGSPFRSLIVSPKTVGPLATRQSPRYDLNYGNVLMFLTFFL